MPMYAYDDDLQRELRRERRDRDAYADDDDDAIVDN